MKKPAAKKPFNLDAICEAIAAGASLREIAAEYDRSVSKLCEWLADPERAERYRQAREASAHHWDAKAGQVLEDLRYSKAKWKFEVTKARELASHYRWRAAKVAPRLYGDKVAVGGDPDAPPIQTAIQVSFVTPGAA